MHLDCTVCNLTQFIFKKFIFISDKFGIHEIPEELSYQIDSEHDLNLIENIIKNMGNSKW